MISSKVLARQIGGESIISRKLLHVSKVIDDSRRPSVFTTIINTSLLTVCLGGEKICIGFMRTIAQNLDKKHIGNDIFEDSFKLRARLLT